MMLLSVPNMAQKPLTRSFQDFKNFNASHIYDIEQDAKGYIWVATENGLFQFDGLQFNNISEENGITNTIFTNLFLDKDGILWTTQSHGHTWRINNQTLIPQRTKRSWPKCNIIPIKGTFNKIGDTLSFTTYSKDYYRFANDSLLEHTMLTEDQTIFQYVKQYNNNWKKRIALYLQIHKEKLFNSNKFKFGYASSFCNDSSFLLSIGNLKLFNKKNEIEYQFENNAIYASCSIDTYQLISKQDVGLIMYDKGIIVDTLFKGTKITEIFTDVNHGVWIGTQNKGLFNIPSLDVYKYCPGRNDLAESINDAIQIKNQLIILENHTFLKTYNSKNNQFDQELELPIRATKLAKTNSDNILVYNDYEILIVNTRNNYFKIKKRISLKSPVFHATLKSERIYIAGVCGISIYSLTKKRITNTLMVQQQFNQLSYWNDKIYANNAKGLWEINESLNIEKTSSLPVYNMNSQKDNLFVQYGRNKLEILSVHFNKIINIYEPLNINHVFNADSLLFLSTNKGIKILDNNFHFTKKYNHLNAFSPNTRFKKTFIIGDKVIVMKNSGIFILPIKSPSLYHNYQIQLQTQLKSKTNGNEITLFIDKDVKNIHLNLSTFNYRNNNPTPLYYKINQEENIRPIQNNELNITQFSSGISYLEISDNKNFYPNFNYLTIVLKKAGYWYQNIFIQILLLVVSIIISSLIIYNKIRSIKNRNMLEITRIGQLQTVLQQQMNPHFIFNSLTSINHFVLQNKPMDSSRYLTKFSTLIRKILDNSAQEKVNLSEELEALYIYLELELLRFKDKFSYSVKMAPDINEHNLKIVPFLIQPIIDRAIKDNILNKPDKGTILIQFQKNARYLTCNIIDNGINIHDLNPDKNKLVNKSVKNGTQIAKQRIELYNKLNSDKIFVSYEVIRNHKNEITGNKTTIRYPIKH